MEPQQRTLVIGTRRSKLALWQANFTKDSLEKAWPGLTCILEPIMTRGDRALDVPLPQMGGKGVFTEELEARLHDGTIDLAVHSLKDLPVGESPGLAIGTVGERADVHDVLVSNNEYTLNSLPAGSMIGTSSLRRQAQLLAWRTDLTVAPIRGNVDTRIRKVLDGEYDGVVLAAAGVTRLGLEQYVSQWLPLELMLPAPGQGALAVQCRRNDQETRDLLRRVHDPDSWACVVAERTFLDALGGGCSLPVGAYAVTTNGEVQLSGLVAKEDGSQVIRVQHSGREPVTVGRELAEMATIQGARSLLQ
jgi:hydroxymethylbilane synthase